MAFENLKAKVEAEYAALSADGRSIEEKFLAFFNLGAVAHARDVVEAEIRLVIEDTAKATDQKVVELKELYAKL